MYAHTKNLRGALRDAKEVAKGEIQDRTVKEILAGSTASPSMTSTEISSNRSIFSEVTATLISPVRLLAQKYGRSVGYYAAIAFATAVIFLCVMKIWRTDPHIAVNDVGDCLFVQVLAKSVQSGWWWWIPALSAPFGLDLVDVGVACNLDFVFFKAFGLFTSSPGLIVNLYWLVSVVLSSITAAFCLKRMAVESRVAATLGILYALSPWTYWRNTPHVLLALYMVPFCVLFVFLVLRGEIQSKPNGLQRGLLIALFLMGFEHTYIPFFAAFLVISALIFRFIADRKDLSVRLASLGLCSLLVGTALNLLPTGIYRFEHGSLPEIKIPLESEMYGLKLRHLVTPVTDHPFRPFRKFAERAYGGGFLYENENRASQLGTTGTIGLFILIGYCLLGLAHPKGRQRWTELKPLAFIVLTSFFLATIGGLGTIFSLFVSPVIRAYARISIFILFASLAAVGVISSRYIARVSASRRVSMVLLNFILVLWVSLGVVDQKTGAALVAGYDVNRAAFVTVDEFVRRIEPTMKPGAAIFQLPFTGFINDGKPGEMQVYDHARGFLHTQKLKFTWGALTGRNKDWWRMTAELPIPDLLRVIKAAGFSGIWIDRAGYPDGAAAMIESLESQALDKPIRSADDRLWFFRVHATEEPRLLPADANDLRRLALQPIELTWSTGFYPEEQDPSGIRRWHWSTGSAELQIENPLNEPRKIVLSTRLSSLEPLPVPLQVLFQGQKTIFRVDRREMPILLPLNLSPHQKVTISFKYPGNPRSVAGDPRRFGFSAINTVAREVHTRR